MNVPSDARLAELAQELQQPEFREIAKYMITRRLRTRDYESIKKVLAAIPSESQHRLKEAIFYLEYADWNLHDVFMHMELDSEDRNGSWLPAEPGENIDASKKTDDKKRKRGGKADKVKKTQSTLKPMTLDCVREYARPGVAFDESLFTLAIKPHQARCISTFDFPESYRTVFNKESQDDVDDLNRWRRAVMWSQLGRDNGKTQRSHGEKWHPLQETFVRNRFALVTTATESKPRTSLVDIRPDYKGITHHYNQIFVGVMLPGRATASKARTHTSVASFLHRDCIDRPLQSSGLNKATLGSLPTNVKHEMARDSVTREWKKKIDAANTSPADGHLIYQQ